MAAIDPLVGQKFDPKVDIKTPDTKVSIDARTILDSTKTIPKETSFDCKETIVLDSKETTTENGFTTNNPIGNCGIGFKSNGSKGAIGPVPRFIVHLDAPVSERWREVTAKYKSHFVHADEYITSIFGGHNIIESVTTTLFTGLVKLGLVMYGEELQAISKQSGFALGKLALLQLAYEGSAFCTSIVAPCLTLDGRPIHGRTMDWNADFLRAMTIEVDYRRHNKTVFLSTGWAGFIGVLTGVRQGAYSVSVNFRRLGESPWLNLKKGLQSAWPIGFLVRSVLENNTITNFDTACKVLGEAQLMAPVYITLCGIKPGEGAILTRNREGEENRWRLKDRGPCVQTNMDHWRDGPDILQSRGRRIVCRQFFKTNTTVNTISDIAQLWSLLSTDPICNDEFIYACVMDPVAGTLATRVPGLNITSDIQQIHSLGLTLKNFDMEQELQKEPDIHKQVLAEEKARLVAHNAIVVGCKNCGKQFQRSQNTSGACVHHGTWHFKYSQCKFLKCGWGLGIFKIGSPHWSCCYSTNPKLKTCSNSIMHVEV